MATDFKIIEEKEGNNLTLRVERGGRVVAALRGSIFGKTFELSDVGGLRTASGITSEEVEKWMPAIYSKLRNRLEKEGVVRIKSHTLQNKEIVKTIIFKVSEIPLLRKKAKWPKTRTIRRK